MFLYIIPKYIFLKCLYLQHHLMISENNRNINSDLSPFLQHTWQESEGEGRGNQSPIWGGKAFMLFCWHRKKNMTWSPQFKYGKRCRNQTSRSYVIEDWNWSWIIRISSNFFACRICYSFTTCSSYTTCCKARKMSQDRLLLIDIFPMFFYFQGQQRRPYLLHILDKIQYNPELGANSTC